MYLQARWNIAKLSGEMWYAMWAWSAPNKWNMVNGSSQNQDGNKSPTVPIGSAGPDKVYCGALWQKRNSQLLHLERVEKSKVARVPKARSRECIWQKKGPHVLSWFVRRRKSAELSHFPPLLLPPSPRRAAQAFRASFAHGIKSELFKNKLRSLLYKGRDHTSSVLVRQRHVLWGRYVLFQTQPLNTNG